MQTELEEFDRYTAALREAFAAGTLPGDRVIAGMERLLKGDFGGNVINLDADPALFMPDSMGEWSVKEHRRGGTFEHDPAKIALFLSEEQQGDGQIGGEALYEKLKNRPVCNANYLDWYLRPENQRFIPESWRKERVFFWGTVYLRPGGRLCVRYLCWRQGKWRCSDYRLDTYRWTACCPAAVREA